MNKPNSTIFFLIVRVRFFSPFFATNQHISKYEKFLTEELCYVYCIGTQLRNYTWYIFQIKCTSEIALVHLARETKAVLDKLQKLVIADGADSYYFKAPDMDSVVYFTKAAIGNLHIGNPHPADPDPTGEKSNSEPNPNILDIF